MRGQEHLGFWIGLVVLLSLLAIVIVVIAVGSLFGETQPIVKSGSVQKQRDSGQARHDAGGDALAAQSNLHQNLADSECRQLRVE